MWSFLVQVAGVLEKTEYFDAIVGMFCRCVLGLVDV